MSATKDPWLAVNLSWTAAGLGPLYAGRKGLGMALLAVELILWGVWLSWAIVPGLPLGVMLSAQASLLILWISSAWQSARSIRREFPPEPGVKSPWKAVFFSRFIPGLGHLYARHWGKGLFFVALTLVVVIWPVRESLEIWQTTGLYVAKVLILIDAFLILRRENPAGPGLTWLALGAILIGTQTWLLIGAMRTCVLEVYHIPSSAMEPTLMGAVSDSHSLSYCPFGSYHQVPTGDRIVVSKPSYLLSPIRRFDVAVFKFPLNQSKNFVKRVVGLPDEELMIHAGDLFVRPKGGSAFEIVRKPLDVQDRIWIRMDGAIGARRPILDPQGGSVADVRLSFELLGEDGAEKVARISNALGTLELEFPKGRPARLRLLAEGKEPKPFSLEPGSLVAGRWHAVELMYFDGQAVVRLDSTVLGRFPLVTSLDEAKALRESPTEVSFAGLTEGISARAVRVDRDIHYRGRENREFGLREDEALKIPANQYVCFGDNVQNSHDARAWVKRTFVLKDGRKIVCETQQVNEEHSRFNRQLQDNLRLPEPPIFAIDGDEQGREVAVTREQFDHEEPPEALRFVDRRFFVGRVVKIWWPLVRAGPVR